MDEIVAAQVAMRQRHAASKVPWEVRRQELNEVLYAPPPEPAAGGGGGEGDPLDGWLRTTYARLDPLVRERPLAAGIIKVAPTPARRILVGLEPHVSGLAFGPNGG